MRKNIIIILGINTLGIFVYFTLENLLNQQSSLGWIYFGVVFVLSFLIHLTFKYLDYSRINSRLKEFQQNFEVTKKAGNFFFSSAVKLTAWIILVAFILVPSLQVVQGSILEQNEEKIIVIEKSTVINVPFNVAYTEIFNLAKEYGLDKGVILSIKDKEAELLLFKNEIKTSEDLIAKRIKINDENEVVFQEDSYLPEELLGYSLDLIKMNASSASYLLGYRSLIDTDEKKLYSDLLVLDKEFPNVGINLLQQAYVFDYDADSGMVPQDNIPVIISSTIDIIGDYVIYLDVDLFWKAQNVITKEIYFSNENKDNISEITRNYMVRGNYICILQYKSDNTFLAFDTVSKKFEIIDINN